MGHACCTHRIERNDAMSGDATPADFILCKIASEVAVRDILRATRRRLAAQGIDQDTCGTIELVLAEALNNIVEHAYAATAPDVVRLAIRRHPGRLQARLSDRGSPLPGLVVPEGTLPDQGKTSDDLPEGGYGWFLIRTLTERLEYRHVDGWNQLTLEFNLDPK